MYVLALPLEVDGDDRGVSRARASAAPETAGPTLTTASAAGRPGSGPGRTAGLQTETREGTPAAKAISLEALIGQPDLALRIFEGLGLAGLDANGPFGRIRLCQMVWPVALSRATSMASSPPGVQISLEPSINGDSR